jgi:hypothetical protein
MSEFIVNDNECSIHITTDNCTPPKILVKLVDNIQNKNAGKNKSSDQDKNNQSSNNTKELINKLKKETGCSSELCIIKSSKAKSVLGYDLVNKILDVYFKIEGPKNNIEKWLSNEDIDKTLKQWTHKFKHFYPIPFQMRDFEKKNTELAVLDFKKLYDDGYRYFGCIPNTDWSSGGGQHWFALFFNFDTEPYTLEYFNSSGELPLPEYNSWLNKTEEKLQNKFRKPVNKEIVTEIQNQYDNSSCGCYSLYYIYSRLNGIPMEWFRNNVVEDEKMHDFRKFLFNTI